MANATKADKDTKKILYSDDFKATKRISDSNSNSTSTSLRTRTDDVHSCY